MPVLSRQTPPFQLGAWRVDPTTGQLTQGDEVRRARALVMDLLLHLAARAGEVVSKDELIAGAWGGAAIADSALTSTIAELRELLGDQSRSPSYIQTLPKRGYRLIATITPLEPGSSSAPMPPGAPTSAASAPSPAALSTAASSPVARQPEALPIGVTDLVARDYAGVTPSSQSQADRAFDHGVSAPIAVSAPITVLTVVAVGDQSVVAANTSVDADTSADISVSFADTSDRRGWMRRRRVAFALGAIFAVAAIVSIASITSNSRRRSATASPAASMMRLTIDLPPAVHLAPDTTPRLALTADGTRMVYVARTEGETALYTRTLDQFVAQPIAGTSGASAPFLSPDGSHVGFFANGELRTVPISGGAATIVCAARIALGASWGSDDTIVFSGTHGQGLFEAPAAGGPSRELTRVDFPRGELSHRWPQVLPDGDRVLYTSVGSKSVDAMIVSRRDGKPRVVVEQAQAAMFVPPNRLLFERNGRLHVAAIDPDRFELTGSSRVLVEDLASQGQGYGPPAFAAAGGGVLVYVPVDPHDGERDLVWVDRSGHASSLDAPPRSYMHPRLSRDGRQVLTWLRTRDPDLWLFDIASRALTRLVTGVAARRAAWSPDGRQVMFDAPGPDNPVTLYVASIDGGKARQLRPDITHSLYSGAWTPDGRTLAYVDLTRNTGFDIVGIDTAAPVPEATPILRTLANETAPAFSPDGRWLAFVSDVTGREQVYLAPSPTPGATTTVPATAPPIVPVQVSTQGGREPVWSRRGDELFFRQGDSMLAVRVASATASNGAGAGAASGAAQPRPSEPVTLFSGDFDQRPHFQPSYDVAADGRFLMIRGRAPSTTDARIAVLLRWDKP